MKTFKSTNLIITVSVQSSGAGISRQLFERVLNLSDDILHLIFEMLIVLSFVDLLYQSIAADWSAGVECVLDRMRNAIADFIINLSVMRYVPIPQTFFG